MHLSRHINLTHPRVTLAVAMAILASVPALTLVGAPSGSSPATTAVGSDRSVVPAGGVSAGVRAGVDAGTGATSSDRAVNASAGELQPSDVAPVPPMLAELGAAFALGFSFSSPTPAGVPLDLRMRLSYPGHELAPGTPEPAAADDVAAVTMLEQRLAELLFDPGPIDGLFSEETGFAVTSFQKLTSRPVTGVVDEATWMALADPIPMSPMVEGAAPTRIEVDLDRQVLVVWRDDHVALITRISSGSTANPTPPGSFTITRRITGWRVSRLGRLYNPLYFNDGIAFHGYLSIPTHPASHGCVRLPMYIAEYFPTLVDNGAEVYVVDAEHPATARTTPPTGP